MSKKEYLEAFKATNIDFEKSYEENVKIVKMNLAKLFIRQLKELNK